jgi:hypothetical protein
MSADKFPFGAVILAVFFTSVVHDLGRDLMRHDHGPEVCAARLPFAAAAANQPFRDAKEGKVKSGPWGKPDCTFISKDGKVTFEYDAVGGGKLAFVPDVPVSAASSPAPGQ